MNPVCNVYGIDIYLDGANRYYILGLDRQPVKTWKTITGAIRWIEQHWAD